MGLIPFLSPISIVQQSVLLFVLTKCRLKSQAPPASRNSTNSCSTTRTFPAGRLRRKTSTFSKQSNRRQMASMAMCWDGGRTFRATVPNLARSPPDLRLPPRKRKTMTSICSAQTTRKTTKKPSESRLSESPPTMRANRRRRTRRAKWWRRATSSSTSNRGTTKPRCQRWKNRSDRWKWTDCSGERPSLSQSDTESKKLQITCVVEDDKVSTDDLEDKITAFEDYVQSMDIVAFNKI